MARPCFSRRYPWLSMGEGGGIAHLRVQSIVRVSRQRLPSKQNFFLKRLSWFLLAPAFYLDEGARQAPGKYSWLPAPSQPASSSRGGGVLERTTHCYVAPIWWGALFWGRKSVGSWYLKLWSNTTSVKICIKLIEKNLDLSI